MKKNFYITTPLYYVNANPHIGHAYTNVLCDTFAAYHRERGEKVFFLTGTDEFGTKIEKAAKESKETPKAYVDKMVPRFQELWRLLGIRYDYFIRTTDEGHQSVVKHILQDLEKKGDIYKAGYEGWYCTPCESFWTELQLVEEKCPDCHREVQRILEENYFFRLSKYQDWLINYIQSHDSFIQPENRRNEILGFLKAPLEDLCITRPKARLSWGIEFPVAKDYVVYVWFDALINYVSAVKFCQDAEYFATYWPADVHVIGKDILRQHAVYWPIMLKACGLEMPKKLLVHGWWTMAGAKVSKSRGNIVDPVELVKKYGVDAFRYFMLHEVTVGFDGAYSEELFRERYNHDLADDLGNLWFRFATMVSKYCDGKIPETKGSFQKASLLIFALELWEPVTQAMQDYDPRAALESIWKVVVRANQYIEEKKPWVLAKDASKKEELEQVLVVLAETLAHIAYLLRPFIPETSYKILNRLNLDKSKLITNLGGYQKMMTEKGKVVEKGDALFPKIEE